jgi:hypothetical protein
MARDHYSRTGVSGKAIAFRMFEEGKTVAEVMAATGLTPATMRGYRDEWRADRVDAEAQVPGCARCGLRGDHLCLKGDARDRRDP